MDFTDTQIERYARHIVLQEVGGAGQQKLLDARVLVIGAGGLGSPVIQYLAAAGVGTIGIADADVVSLSNLQRQVIHAPSEIGTAKVSSAADAVTKINPDVKVIPHTVRVDVDNVESLIRDYDIVADGSDNFATRFLLNDACFLSAKTLVSAAVLRFDGQLATYRAHRGTGDPCYRCIFPAPPPADLIPSCAEGGVLGAMAGVMGTLQATEIIKEILDIGESLAGHLLIFDGLAASFRKVRVKRDPNCSTCGAKGVTDLSRHRAPAA